MCVCLSVCLLTNLWQIYTEQQRGDHAVAHRCFERKSRKIRVFTVFGPVSNQVHEYQTGFRGPKNCRFSLFWGQFQIKSTNTRPAFGDPKIVVFSLFLDQFQIKSTNTRPAFGDPKLSFFTVFGPVSNQVEYQTGFRGPKNCRFSLFLDQFQIKSTNTRPAFGDPKIVGFHCFWTHFCSYCVLRAPALQSVV